MGGMTKQQRLVKAILAIQNDTRLNDEEKARKRQELLSGKWTDSGSSFDSSKVVAKGGKKQTRGMCDAWICMLDVHLCSLLYNSMVVERDLERALSRTTVILVGAHLTRTPHGV